MSSLLADLCESRQGDRRLSLPPTYRSPTLISSPMTRTFPCYDTRFLGALAVALVTIAAPEQGLDECIDLPRKPMRVSGLLCGQIFDIIGEVEPETDLYLRDDRDVGVMKVTSDAAGNFSFPKLPKGHYRLTGGPWTIGHGQVEITDSGNARCRQ